MTSASGISGGAAGTNHWAVCTTVSKSHLASVRSLSRSLSGQHPEAKFYVLLVDRADGCFSPANEPFELVELEALQNVPDLRRFLFKYTAFEACMALKPRLMEHLFDKYQFQKLVYLDGDILLYSPLDEVISLLERCNGVLTPHLTAPIPQDGHRPSEVDVLRGGTYNLGFLALANRPSARAFLSWWGQRLHDRCIGDLDRGYLHDQKWVDLAPGMFQGLHLLRDPRYNIAYWNLHERAAGLALKDGSPSLHGEPVVFFHFSGYDPDQPEVVSKHQDRFLMDDLPQVRPLFEQYRRSLLDAGYHQTRLWPYAFGCFDNGMRIPDIARAVYREMEPQERDRFGDPFGAEGEGSFLAWLNEPAEMLGNGRGDGELTRLWERLYRMRPELQRAFRDPVGEGPRHLRWIRKLLYLRWVQTQGIREAGLQSPLVGVDADSYARHHAGWTGRLAAATSRRRT